MKIITVVLSLICSLVFTSCSKVDYAGVKIRVVDSETIIGYEQVCIDGHVYYSSSKRLAIKLNDDGTPIKCGERSLK